MPGNGACSVFFCIGRCGDEEGILGAEAKQALVVMVIIWREGKIVAAVTERCDTDACCCGL